MLGVPDRDHTVDVFGGTAEEGSFEDAVWNSRRFLFRRGGRRFEVEEG